MNEIVKDQYWTNCQTISTGRQVTKILTGLSPSSTYRIQVQSTSDYGNTQWSAPQIFTTSIAKNSEIHKRPKLFARGTSAVNHDEAIVMLDDTVILKNAFFKGLYLVVLNRLTLELEYTSNSNTDIFNKLVEIDEDHIIIIVSWNMWEFDFSIALGDQLQKFGGVYIKEFQYQYSRRFSEQTRRRFLNYIDISERKNFYHPFAFIGIKGIKPGMAFESIRSNKGYYLQESPQPKAELTVFLYYNVMTNRYVFDNIQVESQMRMNEDYDVIHNSIDRSLQNIIQYLGSINLTVSINAIATDFEYVNLYLIL